MSVHAVPLRKTETRAQSRPEQPVAERAMQETPFGRRTRLSGIGEVAREFGVTLRALRFYESRGLLQPIRQGTQRFYGPLERARLQVILAAKDLGFTLAEITSLLDIEDGTPSLRLDPATILRQIEFLENQHRTIETALGSLRQRYYMMAEQVAPSP